MAKKIVRKAEDAAGIGPYARERERLVRLGELRGWNVVDGEADIRGWEVKTIAGKVLGGVRELLVDRDAGEVVMLDVDLAGSGRHAYLPLRLAEIDRARRLVRADSADLEVVDAGGGGDETRVEATETTRQVRYAGDVGERVLERRPIVEETVVRRRAVDEPESRP